MISVDYLIIGGGIAGTTAAETLRAHDSIARIAILEREPYPLYSKVLIPQFLKKKISRNNLFLRTMSNYEDQDIAMYVNCVVTGFDTNRNEVYALMGDKTQEVFSYKKLLISCGGAPKDIPKDIDFGADTIVLRMHTLYDANNIKIAMEQARTKNALVFGEGFIGMEFIDIFMANGFKVYFLCTNSFFGEKRFGFAGARLLEAYYEREGVHFFKNIKDEELKHKETWLVDSQKKVDVSLVGVGVGINRVLEPFTSLDHNIGIATDEYFQTSNPFVWAAGDIAEYYDTISGRRHVSGNWTSAFTQGRVAALNMLGIKTPHRTVPSYTIVSFGLNITLLGDWEEFDDSIESVGSIMDPYLIRLLFKGNKFSGAVLINRFNDKTHFSSMIERGATRNELEQTIQKKS